jgi:hypothetical protein
MKLICLALLTILIIPSPVLGADQIHASVLDGFRVPCTGTWQSWPIDGSRLDIYGGTLVMDSSGSFADAALYYATGQPAGDAVAIFLEGHIYGSGRFQFKSGLPSGTYITTPGRFYLGGVCEPGQDLSIYAVFYWKPSK